MPIERRSCEKEKCFNPSPPFKLKIICSFDFIVVCYCNTHNSPICLYIFSVDISNFFGNDVVDDTKGMDDKESNDPKRGS